MSESDDTAAFRAQVREFLAAEFTPELRREAAVQSGVFASPDLVRRWQAVLHRRGWAAPAWPTEYGGPGWTPRERYIFDHECAEAGTPILPAMGLGMCGPVLMKFGTAQQKARFLPRILSGEDFWCQGYSEPQSGSDLASLQCRAVKDDADSYLVTGTKIWTTHAHAANWMFMLVRTSSSGKPQQGITFLLVPMQTPGITVRPIRSMSGEHEINQVFFDAVRVPVENRVGEENGGWTVAKYLLEFERGGVSRSARVKSALKRALASAREERADGGLLCDDADFRRRFTELSMAQEVLRALEWRSLNDAEIRGQIGDSSASTLKLLGSELLQEATTFAMDAIGDYALADQRSAQPIGPEYASLPTARYLNQRAGTIFGGSSEVQRNILSRLLIDR
jgi:alkylation response protein AidB-like acyl-CoA dehydrogenase